MGGKTIMREWGEYNRPGNQYTHSTTEFWRSAERFLEGLPLIGPTLKNERRALYSNEWWNQYEKKYKVKADLNARGRDMYGGGIGQGYTFYRPTLPSLYEEAWY